MGDLEEETQEQFTHDLAGEWELYKSHNYDEFLQAIGQNVVARRIATKANPVIEIDQMEDEVIIRTLKGPFTWDEKLTVGGEPSLVSEPDGQVLKLSARWTCSGLCVKYVPVSGSRRMRAYTVTRQPTLDGRLIVKCQVGDIACTRIFRKVQQA